MGCWPEGSEGKVDGASPRGLWPPDGGGLCSLALRGQRPFGPRVADCRSAAMLIKSALRIYLSVSYGMKSITSISHLRWLSPLWCLTAPPSPRGIGRATKGKRLYGQARRLTSPDLHILCRMCTVDNKTLKSGPRIKFPCHRKGTQGHYGIYLPVSSGKWRSAKVSFLGAASFTWAAYVRVFVLSFL